ncbi:MAG: hypothetical protein PHW45_04395, partial [Candidatus ainarchaeum sp.]|nr:hypothetical protein [Candidatus ainarchaeum sp.]
SKIKLIEEKDIKTRKLANISNNLSGFRFLGILSALGVFFIPIVLLILSSFIFFYSFFDNFKLFKKDFKVLS